MSLEHSVKTEPAMQEEQDDLLLYYLNTDYLSTETPPWPLDSALPLSPPYMDKPDHGRKGLDDWFVGALHAATLPEDAYVRPALLQGAVTSGCPSPALAAYAHPLIASALSHPRRHSPSPGPSSCSSSSSSVSDHEPCKRKRGRKKRGPSEVASISTSVMTKSSAMLMPLLPALNHVKHEVVTPPPPTTTSMALAARSDAVESASELQKAAVHAKRQERLIKNRAAAILSRKRKREHLTTLEEQKKQLATENTLLKKRVAVLEGKVESLRQENEQLREAVTGADDSQDAEDSSAHKNIQQKVPGTACHLQPPPLCDLQA